MNWKKTDNLVKRRMNQHGLGELVEAGQICRKAEELYPDLFRAVSVKNNCLHLEVPQSKRLAFTLIRGKLVQDLNSFAKTRELPEIEKLRLTFPAN